ncbi:MAG TPA: ABC transporter permease, partial [Candidatus Sulfopaludibacter sp.]|nr:ABC transporter permease [Candidatus Sulfopaludibacter sp.]
KRMAAGLSRPEAVRQAGLALGGLDQVKEECREARGLSLLETARQDLRYALRGMRRRPSVTAAAILTLGLGTGAIATVFTLANTLFFRRLPVDRPDRVVIVQATRRHGRIPGWISYPDYADFRDHARTLEGLAAYYSNAPLFTTAGSHSQEVIGAVVSGNFFKLLGIRPALGRFFSPEEDRIPDRDAVAVLSYDLWRNWFAAAPEAVGATIKINGTFFTVIGVAPQTFPGVSVQHAMLYIPAMMARTGYRWCADAFARDCDVFDMLGRLRDGYTLEQAHAEIATLLPPSWAAAKKFENSGLTVLPARGTLDVNVGRTGEIRFVELLAGVAGVLLLVCCANLAGLLIARNSARSREFAIRASLGAGSGRLLLQLITEAVLLAVGGAAAGLLFSLGLTAALNARLYSVGAGGHPLYYNFNPEPVVVLAVLAISIAAGLLVGILPALHAIRGNTADDLKRRSSAVSAAPRLGRWLAGAQAGIGVALAAMAGLLISSAQAMISGIHFDSSHVALFRVRPRLIQYSPEKAQRFLRAVVARLESTPGVESVSMVGSGAVLLGRSAPVSLPGQPDTQGLLCGYIEIAPRYFETLRTPLLRGREFDARDTTQSPPVAIVSRELVRRLWPGGSPIGATIVVNGAPRQVVGMVEDVTFDARGEPTLPYVFTPFCQNPAQVDASFCVRVRGNPEAMLPALGREVNRADPDVPVAELLTLPMQISGGIQPQRIAAAFVSFAAVLALLLSAIGLYGALAFAVARRTKEIGIRMAVGAESAAVLRMVIREGMVVVFAGIAIGMMLASAGTGLIRHLLYGSGAADPPIYAAAVIVAISVGLLACWIPARRAASIEPVMALREE